MTTQTELVYKINKLLVENLAEDELAMISDIEIQKSAAEKEYIVAEIDKYFSLVAAGENGYMWISNGIADPEEFDLPDPNEEAKKRMGDRWVE